VAVALVCSGIQFASAATMTLSEAFSKELSMPRMVLFLDSEDSPNSEQVELALQWTKELTPKLMPQLLPIAVTNTSENREILKTFGIDASYTLPVVASINETLEPGKQIQMKVMKGDFTYANLLAFADMVKNKAVTAPPAKYSTKEYRVNHPGEFYNKCIKPGDGRCVIFIVETPNNMLDLQKFRELVMGFSSIERPFRFMWLVKSQMKELNLQQSEHLGFPQLVMIDPKEKVFAPINVDGLDNQEMEMFLAHFDTKKEMRQVKQDMDSKRHEAEQGTEGKDYDTVTIGAGSTGTAEQGADHVEL